MLTASEIIAKYISFFEKRGHKQIPNAPLVPENDPTTLFTSSGMQPLVSYFLGESHSQGKCLVNVQNCFRAQDIDEIGDNRHTTFFRMLGNWSLGEYFKKEQLPWFFEFLTKELSLPKGKLYVSIFEGYQGVPKDVESYQIWKSLGLTDDHIFFYGVEKNWWSRSGPPDKMPVFEIGGPDSEVFFDFEKKHDPKFGKQCHINCDCGRFMEIGNSVFIQYQKQEDGSLKELSQKNVDFGGGLERLLAASENKQDIFRTSLLLPIVQKIELLSGQSYSVVNKNIRIIIDHLVSSLFIISSGIVPGNKEQGYILRRLIRRALDNYYLIKAKGVEQIIEGIVQQYKETDPHLVDKFETIKNTVIEEQQKYEEARTGAIKYLSSKYPTPTPIAIRGDEIMGTQIEISPIDAFNSLATYGTAPTQLKSLGYTFDEQKLAETIKDHQETSRQGAGQKFRGGLADHSEKTIMGHTATHLLHQALRDVLGNHVHQTGSNITVQRLRFDFNFDRKLTDEELKKVETIINGKIKEDLSVHFEIMPLKKAKQLGAIGLFDEKYQDNVKVYLVGGYSKEFCGGPHVEHTGVLKIVKLIKQENIGHGQRRIYAVVG